MEVSLPISNPKYKFAIKMTTKLEIKVTSTPVLPQEIILIWNVYFEPLDVSGLFSWFRSGPY